MTVRALAITALVAALARTAGADDFDDARKLAVSLDYAGALAHVEAALAHGGAEPARVVEMHMFAGRMAAGLERRDVAVDHYARALAIKPDVALAAGTSPKLAAPFETARARGLAPLHVHAEVAPGLARVVVDADPLALVAGIAVAIVDAHGMAGEVSARTSMRVAIPAGATAVEVSALDASGNRIAVERLPSPDGTPVVIRLARPAAPRGVLARWTTWAAVGGVALAGGGVLAWRERVAQSDYDRLSASSSTHDFSLVRAVERRGERYAISADVAFAVGAGSAIAALALALTSHEAAPSHPAGLGLRVVTGAGQLGLAVGGAY